jgi:hypothetical protein
MVKFTLSTLALALSLSSTAAFAPAAPRTVTRVQTALSATDTPLAPLTVWGSPIPDILSSQNKLKSKPLEFAPTIRASDVGLRSDDKEGQLDYIRQNKNEIKQRMVDCGAGEKWWCLLFVHLFLLDAHSLVFSS